MLTDPARRSPRDASHRAPASASQRDAHPHPLLSSPSLPSLSPAAAAVNAPDLDEQTDNPNVAQRALLLRSLVRFVSVLSLETALLSLGVTVGRLSGLSLLQRVVAGLLPAVLFDNGYKAWLLWEEWREEGGGVRRKLLVFGLIKGLLLGVFLVAIV